MVLSFSAQLLLLYYLSNRLPQIIAHAVVLTVSIVAIESTCSVANKYFRLSLQSPYKNKAMHTSIQLEILNLSTIMKAGDLHIIH